MGEFNLEMSVEEILEKMNNNKGNTEMMHAGPCFLQHKLHKLLLLDESRKHKEILDDQGRQHRLLLENQNNYNGKQLFWSRCLVIGTWFLVFVTAMLWHSTR